ncbi:MAG: 2OG-Fe(II) oxygenase [Woeseiaceae bacterium]|nr:2OG-Fe(II) oxygenase [Woeseiaceae bacterium]
MSASFCRTSVDWAAAADALDDEGYALTGRLLTPRRCRQLRRRYDDAKAFRSVIDMQRHNFGRGQYKYFDYPLPRLVEVLRKHFYAGLAPIANRWNERLDIDDRWPDSLDELTARCHAAGQRRPTPLLLRYRENDYNCLHQDLYGDIRFPFQVIVLLSRPGEEFEGGELILVEQRPRMQSRPMVVPIPQGCAAIIPVRERPREGRRGWYRTQLRHGVSRLRRGERFTLGLIFHDAA